jgi:GNAT superfamily N-acetyltransferase
MDSERSDSFSPSYAPVVCRLARQADTADVLALTKTIWGGTDYVPHVWQEWVEDRSAPLFVAELDRRVVGLARLAQLEPGEWWLQGLRVHPQFEGRGIASQLHQHVLQEWEQNGNGVVRLSTFQPAVKHLSERTGFTLLHAYSVFAVESLPESSTAFRRISESEALTARHKALSKDNPLAYVQFIDLGWEWVRISEPRTVAVAREGRAWTWAEQGTVIWFQEEDEGLFLHKIGWLDCAPELLANFLADFRRLGFLMNCAHVGWVAPLIPPVLEALEKAGYRRYWDDYVNLYEKPHPRQ